VNYIDCAYRKYERNAYKILVGKPDLKRRLGNPRNGWVDSVETPHKGIGCEKLVLYFYTSPRIWCSGGFLYAVLNLVIK
jgi:hypothetical protein